MNQQSLSGLPPRPLCARVCGFGTLRRFLLVLCCGSSLAWGQSPTPPVEAPARDRVAQLVRQLESGQAQLEWDETFGWLPSVLQQLEISPDSQTLVFSKTSLQLTRIHPRSPRAVYFNDEVYLGYVLDGEVLELAAVDPLQGAAFYTLSQQPDQPAIKGAGSQCLTCHESHKTQQVPGFLVRSVFPKASGHPEYRLGTQPTDHRTPFIDRFGGWYVTGQHGAMRHRGNATLTTTQADSLDREAAANLAEVARIHQPDRYLRNTSDIVALMTLEHQSQFHNFVARATTETHAALQYQIEMNRLLEREPDYQSDSTQRRIRGAAEDLVRYLFFVDEYVLTSPVQGKPEFVEQFLSRAVRDDQGRSLRDLDLQTRLLKYPCSYLVYTDAFLQMPVEVRQIVLERMREILEGRDTSKPFRHLSPDQRREILEILEQTHPLFAPATETAS